MGCKHVNNSTKNTHIMTPVRSGTLLVDYVVSYKSTNLVCKTSSNYAYSRFFLIM